MSLEVDTVTCCKDRWFYKAPWRCSNRMHLFQNVKFIWNKLHSIWDWPIKKITFIDIINCQDWLWQTYFIRIWLYLHYCSCSLDTYHYFVLEFAMSPSVVWILIHLKKTLLYSTKTGEYLINCFDYPPSCCIWCKQVLQPTYQVM